MASPTLRAIEKEGGTSSLNVDSFMCDTSSDLKWLFINIDFSGMLEGKTMKG